MAAVEADIEDVPRAGCRHEAFTPGFQRSQAAASSKGAKPPTSLGRAWLTRLYIARSSAGVTTAGT
jgi:hypothetical protein